MAKRYLKATLERRQLCAVYLCVDDRAVDLVPHDQTRTPQGDGFLFTTQLAALVEMVALDVPEEQWLPSGVPYVELREVSEEQAEDDLPVLDVSDWPAKFLPERDEDVPACDVMSGYDGGGHVLAVWMLLVGVLVLSGVALYFFAG